MASELGRTVRISHSDAEAAQTELCKRLLDVIEHDILPITRAGVAEGNKAFGAAILRKSDLSLVIADANRENQEPPVPWRDCDPECVLRSAGDGSAENQRVFFPDRPRILSHVPVGDHLGGVRQLLYLFDYTATRDTFRIPHNLKILQDVFRLPDGAYAHRNDFWHCHDVNEMAAASPDAQAAGFRQRIGRIREAFVALSETYQQSKSANDIPLN